MRGTTYLLYIQAGFISAFDHYPMPVRDIDCRLLRRGSEFVIVRPPFVREVPVRGNDLTAAPLNPGSIGMRKYSFVTKRGHAIIGSYEHDVWNAL